MNSKSLRQRIISKLIQSQGLSIAQLTEETSASRVSVSKELKALKECGAAEKTVGSSIYALSPSISFIIFKIYNDGAEIVSYSPHGSCEREKIDLVYSLSYEDNIIFLAPRIEKYRERLEKSFGRVITCIVHDKKISYTPLVSRVFKFASTRAELISRQIQYVSDNEAVLYISNCAPISFLCKNGAAITPNSYPNEKTLKAPQSALSLIKPSRVILEGAERESLAFVCSKNNIPFRFINTNGGLYTDELGMIEEALYEISKNEMLST